MVESNIPSRLPISQASLPLETIPNGEKAHKLEVADSAEGDEELTAKPILQEDECENNSQSTTRDLNMKLKEKKV